MSPYWPQKRVHQFGCHAGPASCSAAEAAPRWTNWSHRRSQTNRYHRWPQRMRCSRCSPIQRNSNTNRAGREWSKWRRCRRALRAALNSQKSDSKAHRDAVRPAEIVWWLEVEKYVPHSQTWWDTVHTSSRCAPDSYDSRSVWHPQNAAHDTELHAEEHTNYVSANRKAYPRTQWAGAHPKQRIYSTNMPANSWKCAHCATDSCNEIEALWEMWHRFFNLYLHAGKGQLWLRLLLLLANKSTQHWQQQGQCGSQCKTISIYTTNELFPLILPGNDLRTSPRSKTLCKEKYLKKNFFQPRLALPLLNVLRNCSMSRMISLYLHRINANLNSANRSISTEHNPSVSLSTFCA